MFFDLWTVHVRIVPISSLGVLQVTGQIERRPNQIVRSGSMEIDEQKPDGPEQLIVKKADLLKRSHGFFTLSTCTKFFLGCK